MEPITAQLESWVELDHNTCIDMHLEVSLHAAIVQSQISPQINDKLITNTTILYLLQNKLCRTVFIKLSLPSPVIKDFLSKREQFRGNLTGKMAYKRAYEKSKVGRKAVSG